MRLLIFAIRCFVLEFRWLFLPQPRGATTTRYGKGPVGTGVVSSVAGGGVVGPNGMIARPNNVFSPEYDDPANIDEEYGYGSPRRGTTGRRSLG